MMDNTRANKGGLIAPIVIKYYIKIPIILIYIFPNKYVILNYLQVK